jgi:hypothetical protein
VFPKCRMALAAGVGEPPTIDKCSCSRCRGSRAHRPAASRCSEAREFRSAFTRAPLRPARFLGASGERSRAAGGILARMRRDAHVHRQRSGRRALEAARNALRVLRCVWLVLPLAPGPSGDQERPSVCPDQVPAGFGFHRNLTFAHAATRSRHVLRTAGRASRRFSLRVTTPTAFSAAHGPF